MRYRLPRRLCRPLLAGSRPPHGLGEDAQRLCLPRDLAHHARLRGRGRPPQLHAAHGARPPGSEPDRGFRPLRRERPPCLDCLLRHRDARPPPSSPDPGSSRRSSAGSRLPWPSRCPSRASPSCWESCSRAKDLDARRVYFFDLLGSALGALLVLPAIPPARRGDEPPASRRARPARDLVAPGPALPSGASRRVCRGGGHAAAWELFRRQLLELQPAAGTPVAEARRAGGGGVEEYVRWDPLARIELSRIGPPDPASSSYPSLLGDDRAFLSRFERMLTQNNYAYRLRGAVRREAGVLRGRRADALRGRPTRSARAPAPRVVAIGVGGGFDILTALHFGAGEVTGVEVNGTILRLLTRDYRDYFRPWVEDPRVRLVVRRRTALPGPGPAALRSSSSSRASTPTAARPGAAHVFSENYLYTHRGLRRSTSRACRQRASCT